MTKCGRAVLMGLIFRGESDADREAALSARPPFVIHGELEKSK
jgi:hypothetical protein